MLIRQYKEKDGSPIFDRAINIAAAYEALKNPPSSMDAKRSAISTLKGWLPSITEIHLNNYDYTGKIFFANGDDMICRESSWLFDAIVELVNNVKPKNHHTEVNKDDTA